jgi:hypothetical protein
MKRLLVLTIVLCCSAPILAQELSMFQDVPKVHKFKLWNTFSNIDKVNFLVGFTNGLLTGAARQGCTDNKPTQALLECALGSQGPSVDQAIAMIDKYYKENPEKWNIPIGDAIMEALTVKGGPCAGMATQK